MTIKESKKDSENNLSFYEQLYYKFLLELDEDSLLNITVLDSIIREKSIDLLQDGWRVFNLFLVSYTSDGKVYRIHRDLNGFRLCTNKINSYNLSQMRGKEISLLIDRAEDLDELHNAMLTRDDIIYNRKYSLKNNDKLEEIEKIREILGFNNPENTILLIENNNVKMTRAS